MKSTFSVEEQLQIRANTTIRQWFIQKSTVRKGDRSVPKSPSKVPQVVAKVLQQMSQRKCKSILEVSDHLVKWMKLEKKEKERGDLMHYRIKIWNQLRSSTWEMALSECVLAAKTMQL